ncbi:uncharacterized protein DS421_20g686620 [Arachis hypogaea]|nr:uncharacterized protein DS421_20g686620 [Arachis hypogaea]
MGLDDASYGTVRSNMLATDHLPSLNHVYAMLVQKERAKTMVKASKERGLVVGLAIQTGNRTKGRGDPSKKSTICSNCDKSRHDVKGCFQIVGYAEWWGDQPMNKGRDGGKGYEQQDTRTRKIPARTHVTHTDRSGSHAINTEDTRREMSGLTNKQ